MGEIFPRSVKGNVNKEAVPSGDKEAVETKNHQKKANRNNNKEVLKLEIVGGGRGRLPRRGSKLL